MGFCLARVGPVTAGRPHHRRTCVRTRRGRVLHADVDAFFASVEQRDDPAPAGQAGGGRRRGGDGGQLRGPRPRRPRRDGRRRARRLCPSRLRRTAFQAYVEASRALFESSRRRRRRSRASGWRRRSSTSAGWATSPAPRRSPPACGAGARAGRPAAERRHRADQVPGEDREPPAKPDGLLACRGPRARVPAPAPVERCGGWGPRRPKAARARPARRSASCASSRAPSWSRSSAAPPA